MFMLGCAEGQIEVEVSRLNYCQSIVNPGLYLPFSQRNEYQFNFHLDSLSSRFQLFEFQTRLVTSSDEKFNLGTIIHHPLHSSQLALAP